MKRSDAPKKQPVPFGINGPRENLLPTTPAGDNTASYDQGFPPVTMILKAAGGLPPKGQDMNQILYELSNLGRWFSAGALNSYDEGFSSAIGGYPKSAVVVGGDGETIFISKIESNTNNPNATQNGWISLTKIMSIASLPGGQGKLPYFIDSNTATQTDLTQTGIDIIGKSDVAGVKSYLGVQSLSSTPSTNPTAFTRIRSPDTNNSIVIANNGDWGAQDESGRNIPLSISRGGTSANTALQARINLGLNNVVRETRTINGKPLSSDITITSDDINAVSKNQTINGKPLSSNIVLTAVDVQAVPVSRTVNNKPLSSDIVLTASDVNAPPTSRTINGKPLSSNITLSPDDVGSVPAGRTINGKSLNENIVLTPSDVQAVPVSRTINNKQLSSDVSLTAADVGAPPTSRTINGKPLSSDITLSATDVSAPTGVSQQLSKAWGRIYFDGSRVVVISSFNISSITRSSAGLYVVTFVTPMINNSYAVITSAFNEGAIPSAIARVAGAGVRSTTAVNIYVYDNNTDERADSSYLEFCVFGD